jgi:hypothetical protein
MVGPASARPSPAMIACGIWLNEIAQEKAAPAATRMKTTAVIRPVDLAISKRSLAPSERKTRTSRMSA